MNFNPYNMIIIKSKLGYDKVTLPITERFLLLFSRPIRSYKYQVSIKLNKNLILLKGGFEYKSHRDFTLIRLPGVFYNIHDNMYREDELDDISKGDRYISEIGGYIRILYHLTPNVSVTIDNITAYLVVNRPDMKLPDEMKCEQCNDKYLIELDGKFVFYSNCILSMDEENDKLLKSKIDVKDSLVYKLADRIEEMNE